MMCSFHTLPEGAALCLDKINLNALWGVLENGIHINLLIRPKMTIGSSVIRIHFIT